MKKKLLKNKKVRYLIVSFVSLPLILMMCFLSLNIVSSLKRIKSGNNISTTYNIEKYDYLLRDNATRLQKKYFKNLEEALSKTEIDDNYVAELIVKNYVADMYTWNNKQGSYDVGGIYFLYSPTRLNFYLQARDRFYVNFEKHKNQAGLENLLEVMEVETTFLDNHPLKVFDGQAVKYFHIKANWQYVDHPNFDENIFATKGEFYVIKNNDGRFEIIVGWE